MKMSHEQFAELLIGIARAQAALGRALTNEQVLGQVIPALQAASGVNEHRPPTVQDLPQRLLIHILGGNIANARDTANRELKRLFPEEN